jgi:hypothetical protein
MPLRRGAAMNIVIPQTAYLLKHAPLTLRYERPGTEPLELALEADITFIDLFLKAYVFLTAVFVHVMTDQFFSLVLQEILQARQDTLHSLFFRFCREQTSIQVVLK